MKSWSIQDAKARFSQMLDACLVDGPQIVTKRGAQTAVLVPIADWQRRQSAARPTLKEILLDPTGRGDLSISERGKLRHRTSQAPE